MVAVKRPPSKLERAAHSKGQCGLNISGCIVPSAKRAQKESLDCTLTLQHQSNNGSTTGMTFRLSLKIKVERVSSYWFSFQLTTCADMDNENRVKEIRGDRVKENWGDREYHTTKKECWWQHSAAVDARRVCRIMCNTKSTTSSIARVWCTRGGRIHMEDVCKRCTLYNWACRQAVIIEVRALSSKMVDNHFSIKTFGLAACVCGSRGFMRNGNHLMAGYPLKGCDAGWWKSRNSTRNPTRNSTLFLARWQPVWWVSEDSQIWCWHSTTVFVNVFWYTFRAVF